MLKIIFLILIVFGLSCKAKSNKIFPPPPQAQEGLYINYGSIQYNTEPISALEKWGINISKQNSIDCINSHSDEFAKRESGPILKLCFPENTIPVEEFQKNLEYLHNSENIFFKGKFLLSGIEIQIDSISKTDAQKELNREDINFALIGESNLLNTIDKKENFYYLFGENKNLESSFSLPYFSILATDLENIILFPPSGFFYGNRRDYLLIRIPTGNSFSEKILSFFNSIKTNSEVLKNNCIPIKLTIEEYSGVSSGYTGKFIELVNSSEEIACSKNISIFSNSMKIDIPETSGFIFPGQTIVFKEENSRLEGIEINYPEFWKEITPGKELKIIQENFEQIFSFPKFTFTQDDFEFSYRWKNFTCSNFQLFPKDKNICSNPGISLPVYHKNSCNLNLLRLHELNLDGIQFNRKLEKTGKFIEFIYTGDEKCSIDLFYLETDNSIIPIYSKNHLENEDILLIGNPDFINFPNILNRSLTSFNYNKEIFLKFDNSILEIYKPYNTTFISNTHKGIYSMIPDNGEPKHHNSIESDYLKRDFKNENFMSPGQKNPESVEPENFQLEFSEINLYGEYDSNGNSITSDKFIELNNNNFSGSIILEYSNILENSKYQIKIEKDSKFPIILSKELTCNPGYDSIIINDISLSKKTGEWKIIYNSKVLDKFYFNSSSPIVIDSSTEKKRKSIVRTGNTWKPSLLEASINCGYINSSPGRKNNFKEFLEKNQLTGNWKLNSPTGNIPDYIFLTAKTYPEITKTFTIYKNGNNEFNLTNLIYEFPENSLIYFGTSIGDESYLNLSNLFISKVNPYPENSQDEWIMICNYSNNSIPVKSLEIKDENSFDEIIPFGQRFPDLRGYSVSLNLNPFNEFLGPKQCAYIVDPDANISLLNDISSFTNLILTVKDTGIGNGISPDEKLDLFQKIDSYRIHLASYGNQYSNSPFVWKTKKGEIIYLKPGKEGYNPEDYSIE